MTVATQTISPTEALFNALNLSAYTPQEQEQLLVDVSDTIFKGTLARVIECMDTATRDDFNALMDKDADGEEITAFLKERVPESDEATLEAVREVTADIVALDISEPEIKS